MAKTRMALTIEPSGHVEIAYDDVLYGQGRVTRRFSTTGHLRPGYVIEHLSGGRTAQVCERLAGTGSTLSCTVERLPEMIRREYRAMRRAESPRAAEPRAERERAVGGALVSAALESAREALERYWGEPRDSSPEGSLIVPIVLDDANDDEEADAALASIRAIVEPCGCVADWTGDGNGDESDIRVEVRAVELREEV